MGFIVFWLPFPGSKIVTLLSGGKNVQGPLASNLFSYDLMFLIQDMCDAYNYADDNSIGCSGSSENEVINKLELVSLIMLKWFKSNYLQANPEKFQFIIYGNICDSYVLSFGDNVSLKSGTSV